MNFFLKKTEEFLKINAGMKQILNLSNLHKISYKEI